MSRYDPFDQGKAQTVSPFFAGACVRAAGPCGIHLVKTVPDQIQLVFRDADPVVFYVSPDFGFGSGKADSDITAFPCVADGVGNQVDEQPDHHGLVCVRPQIRIGLKVKADFAGIGQVLLFFAHNCGQIV